MKRKKSRLASLCGVIALAYIVSNCFIVSATGLGETSKGTTLTNWALNKPYTTTVKDFHGENNDPNFTKLTNGTVAASYDGNLVGFYINETGDTSFTIDLGEDRPIAKTVVSGFERPSWGIGAPGYTIEYQQKNSDTWVTAGTVSDVTENTGKEEDGEGKGYGLYSLTSNENYTASKVRLTFTNKESWTMIDEIQLLGEITGSVCEKPVFQKDLNDFENVEIGQSITLSVEASSPENGTLTYEWFKDGVSLGTNQPSYTIKNATTEDSGNYLVSVVNSKTGYFSSKADSKICLLSVNEPVVVDPNNLAAGKSYTTNIAPGANYADTDPATKLTDSRTGSLNFKDGIWVGYNDSSLAVTLDLKSKQSFGQVEMNFLKTDGPGITFPSRVKVSYSDDQSTWTILSDEAVDYTSTSVAAIYRHQCPVRTESGLVSGRYVKIEVTGQNWIFMDEIKVLKESSIIRPGETDPIEINPNNIAYECSYTSAWPVDSGYPDRGNKMLTDGKRGPAHFRAPQWFGFLSWGGESLGLDDLYVTLDLGAIKSFEQVKTGFLRESGPGIANPSHIKVEYSSDNQNWSVFADEDTAFGNDSRVNRYVATAASAVSGRYVRIHYVMYGWLFLDEVEVFAKAESDGETEANPDNAKEMNLVRGYTNYILSRDPQIGNTAGLLTDGNYSSAFSAQDPYWMGFKSKNGQNNHVSIEFDLYAPNSISQVIVSSRYDSANKLTIPQNMTMSVTNGQGQWTSVKTFENTTPASPSSVKLTWDSEVDTFHAVETGATKLYTQKIRLEFDVPSDGSTVAIDEIKIMGRYGKCSDASEAIVLDEDGSYNVAMYAPYKTSPETVPNSSYTDNGHKLTDGIIATGNYRDSAWVGYHRMDAPLTGGGDYRSAFPVKSYTVDLKSIKSIKSIGFQVYVDLPAGIGDPSSTVYASVDGKTWVTLNKDVAIPGTLPSGLYSYGWNVQGKDEKIIQKIFVEDDMIAARYIRVDMELSGWGFIDEIKAQGYDGQLEGVRLADFGTDVDQANYLTPKEAGGVRDMVLCYNQWGGYDTESKTFGWTYPPEMLRYLLTYVNDNNQVESEMFDTVLFLALGSRYGNDYITNKPNMKPSEKDWYWYLDRTFAKDGDVENLNTAAKKASQELNKPNYKANMVIMYPTPMELKNFGTLESGHEIDFSKEEDWKYAIDWWLDEVLERLETVDHDYINFKGFYWLDESARYSTEMMYFNEAVHAKGLYTYWIPYYDAYGRLNGASLGFDGVTFQPNHMFGSPYEHGGYGELVKDGNGLFETVHKQMNYAHMGPEMEIDGRTYEDGADEYNKFLDYLNAAEQYEYDGPNVHRAWYYANPLMNCAISGEPIIRNLYSYSYQMMKGTYTQKEYISTGVYPDDPAIGKFANNSGFGGSSLDGSTGDLTGGGSTVTHPETKVDFTWEKVGSSYKLKDANNKYVTGWAKVDGKWYFIGKDGVMTTGWVQSGGSWYYLKASGQMTTGWVQVENCWYYMQANGAMKQGWLQQGNTWYYLKANGKMATGWNWIDGKCYYLGSDGKMAVSTTIGGYKVNASGQWVK